MSERAEGWTDETWVVAGGRPGSPGVSLNVPIVPVSNYRLGTDLSYSRNDGSPTWEAFEAVVAGLEGGDTVSFASGMAAISAVFDLLPGDAFVAIPSDCYQGVEGVAAQGEAAGRWTAERIATDDTERWLAVAPRADLMWVETPSNPLLLVADLAAIASAERRPGAVLAVDNTFATPINQRPLALGADISVQSATKFLGGHSDLLGGTASTADAELASRLRRNRSLHGATSGMLESYLALRGTRTLALRLERCQDNAGEIARRLAEHPNVDVVRYPGLPGHPGHEIASRQLAGFGSVLSFDVVGGGDAADAVCRSVRLIQHATSLGGVESTMERRSVIRGQEHLPAGLLRLSVGIEHVEDLWSDLDRALRSA